MAQLHCLSRVRICAHGRTVPTSVQNNRLVLGGNIFVLTLSFLKVVPKIAAISESREARAVLQI